MLMQTIDDAAVVALVPGVVALLRRSGMPARWETAAAVLAGVLLVCLVDLSGGQANVTVATVAGWLLTGLIDGLAAAGLTRVTPRATSRRPAPGSDSAR